VTNIQLIYHKQSNVCCLTLDITKVDGNFCIITGIWAIQGQQPLADPGDDLWFGCQHVCHGRGQMPCSRHAVKIEECVDKA